MDFFFFEGMSLTFYSFSFSLTLSSFSSCLSFSFLKYSSLNLLTLLSSQIKIPLIIFCNTAALSPIPEIYRVIQPFGTILYHRTAIIQVYTNIQRLVTICHPKFFSIDWFLAIIRLNKISYFILCLGKRFYNKLIRVKNTMKFKNFVKSDYNNLKVKRFTWYETQI